MKERQDRRARAIAYILQANAVCGASCFVEKEGEEALYIATNKNNGFNNEQHGLPSQLENTKKYLVSTAEKAQEMKDKSAEDGRSILGRILEEKTNLITTTREALLAEKNNSSKKKGPKKSFLYDNKSFNENLRRSVDKITSSIIASYSSNNEFDVPLRSGMISAISNNDRIILLDNIEATNGTRDVHAEMKIVQKLFDNGNIIQDVEFTIGISKRCCLNCECAIKAVNQIKGTKIIVVGNTEENEQSFSQEGSKLSFAQGIPNFLMINSDIQQAFINIRNDEVDKLITIKRVPPEDAPEKSEDLNIIFSNSATKFPGEQLHRKSESPPNQRTDSQIAHEHTYDPLKMQKSLSKVQASGHGQKERRVQRESTGLSSTSQESHQHQLAAIEDTREEITKGSNSQIVHEHTPDPLKMRKSLSKRQASGHGQKGKQVQREATDNKSSGRSSSGTQKKVGGRGFS